MLGYLMYNKVKTKMVFNDHYIRHAILRVWNKYKSRLCSKILLAAIFTKSSNEDHSFTSVQIQERFKVDERSSDVECSRSEFLK